MEGLRRQSTNLILDCENFFKCQTFLTCLICIVDTILRINVILSPAESEAALGGGVSAANLVGAGENKVDMLEIPGKGRCYVYLAR